MEKEKIEYFKKRLLDEKAKLESELATVGRINPDNPKDWEAVPEDTSRDTDPLDKADNIEEYETNTAILKQLETQLKDVNDALERIEEGKYGICHKGGEIIDERRLEANPSARTCTEHMND